jgi:RND family efflux transporter MFP subunit
MKKYIYIIAAIVIIALVVFKLASNKNKSEDKIYHYDKEAPIEVETITVNKATLNTGNAYAGTFEANKEVKVTADIQGKITEMLVDLGSEVKKGQALIQLDNALLKLQLQAAEVTVKGLENDVNRYTILADADAIQGVQLEKATLGLEAAKIQRATLLEQLSKTTIKAPFDGVVTMKMTETGAFAAPGIPLLQLTEIQQLRFTIFVAENDIDLFKVNDSYPIVPDNNKEQILQGKIIAVGSQSNPAGSFPVQFIVNNPILNQLKSGMFGKVQLQQTTATEGLYIPVSLIQGSEENASVYVVKNNKAVLQKISIKTKIQDKVLVTDGIKQGDVLVSKGFINLFDGANVKMN